MKVNLTREPLGEIDALKSRLDIVERELADTRRRLAAVENGTPVYPLPAPFVPHQPIAAGCMCPPRAEATCGNTGCPRHSHAWSASAAAPGQSAQSLDAP